MVQGQSLKSALFLTKENTQTIKAVSLQVMDFHCDIISYMFNYTICGEEIPKTRMGFFQNAMNFESGFCNFRNIFFTIASNIYVNRR